jgi:Skp family chaperone for outer membrane proteins
VAVVDVQRAFESLTERGEVEARLKAKAAQLEREDQQKQEELKKIQADIEILAAGSPDRLKKEEDLERKVVALQVWRQVENNRLNRERAVQTESLYRKILDACGRVAQTNGAQLVMFKESEVNFSGARPDALPTLIQVRKVLWSAKELDLTDQTIQLMNNEYKNRPGGN